MRKVDFGSIVLSVPDGSRLRLAFGPGDELIAVALVGAFGEIEVRAHAAPKQRHAAVSGGPVQGDFGGQWRAMLSDLAEDLRVAGLRLFFQDGQWGRELVAVGGESFHNLVGRDGDRWTLVAVAVGPIDRAGELTVTACDVLAETEVRRGDEPQPAQALLPLRIVDHAQLGEFERVDLTAHDQHEAEPEPFRAPFPDPEAPGAKGSAMQQLRALQA